MKISSFLHRSKITNLFCGAFATLLISSIITSPLYAQQELSEGADIMVESLTRNDLSGKVIKSGEDQIYISLGSEQGVIAGNVFDVVKLGAPLEVDGQVLGHEETNIGSIEIQTVREKISIAKAIEKTNEIEQGYLVYKKAQNFNRFVVAQFDNGGRNNQFTKTLQDNTINALVNSGYSVVEREQLEKVLQEQKLGYSGLLNTESAQKIGELLGAQAIIVGRVNDTANSVNVTARLVGIAKGETVAANSFGVPKTPEIETMLGTDQQQISAPVGSRPAGKSKGSGISTRVDNIEFEYKGCKKENGQLECAVYLTNIGKDRSIGLTFGKASRPSALTDSDGNNYVANSVRYNECTDGWNQSRYCKSILISKVKTKAILKFEVGTDLGDEAQVLNIEIYDNSDNKEYSAQLRDIKIN